MWTSFFGVLFTAFALSLLFISSGKVIYFASVQDSSTHPIPLKYASSFFLGMSLFIAIYNLLDCIANNSKVGLLLSILIMLIISFSELKKLSIEKFLPILRQKSLIFLFLFAFIVPIANFIQMLGSLHSWVYANIATYILENNYIPSLNLHYGQSILSSTSMIIGFNNPYLALYIWLSLSTFALILFFYGFLIYISVSKPAAAMGTFIIMFGNTALSFNPVGVLSSGSPLIMNGYTDSLLAVGSFLVFFIWLNAWYISDKKNVPSTLLIPLILGVSWNIIAPQNIVLWVIIMGSVFLVSLYRKYQWRKVLAISLFFCIVSGIGVLNGGMLTPKLMTDKVDIPGIRNPYAPGSTGILPILPSHIGRVGKRLYSKIRGLKGRLSVFKSMNLLKGESTLYKYLSVSMAIWKIEGSFWGALRIAFFPIMGIVLLGYILVFANTDMSKIDLEPEHFIYLRNFLFVTSLSFAIGFFISFFFIFSGYKRALSRFLMCGYCMGTISLIISFSIHTKRSKQSLKILTWFFLTFFVTVGPTFKFGERLNRLLDVDRIIPKVLLTINKNGMTRRE